MSIQGDITSGAGGKFLPLTGGTLSGNLHIKDGVGPGINFLGVNSNVEFVVVGTTQIEIGSHADCIRLGDNEGNGKLVTVTGLKEGTEDSDAVNVKQLNLKQDASTAITTSNIKNQTVSSATYATYSKNNAVYTPILRNTGIYSKDTAPTVNGVINWTVG